MQDGSNVANVVFAQLMAQGPTLAVMLLAGIYAATQLGRSALPAVLAIAALGMKLLAMLGSLGVVAWQVGAAQQSGHQAAEVYRVASVLHFALNAAHAVALATLVVAVFVGRGASRPSSGAGAA